MIIILHYENDINKGVGFEWGCFFTLMLDGWENAEADGGCREFGSSGVNRVGRPLVILHTLIMLGYFFLQPHSAWGSVGKESTHWNGREVNRWISCDWELINVRGNWQSSWCGNLRRNKPAQRNSGFYGLSDGCILFRFVFVFYLDLYLHFNTDLDFYFRFVIVFYLDLCFAF